MAGAARGHGASSTRSLGSLKGGDMRAIGASTERNFVGPIQTIIPWAGNLYTRNADRGACARRWARDFWGFWMLGGMSGGGMGFLFDPGAKAEAPGRACRPS